MPSACCNTVGFKPSHGLLPVDGCFPLAPTMDTVGPMARTVADCALAFSVLSGIPVPQGRLAGLRIGLLDRAPAASPHEPGGGGADALPALAAWAEALRDLGAEVVTVELPEPPDDLVPIFLHEAAVSHAATFPSRRAQYGAVSQTKWDVALRVPQDAVVRAYDALADWRAAASILPAVDLVACPTLGIEPPAVSVHEPDVRVQMIAYTRIFNFLGWPALAIGGLQLAGRNDATVLAAGLAWEQATGLLRLPEPG